MIAAFGVGNESYFRNREFKYYSFRSIKELNNLNLSDIFGEQRPTEIIICKEVKKSERIVDGKEEENIRAFESNARKYLGIKF